MASVISDIKYCYDKDMERAFFYKGLLSYKDKTVKLKEKRTRAGKLIY